MLLKRLKISTVLRLISFIVFVGMWYYYSNEALERYESEDVTNRLEMKYGDDDLGNIAMPAITICPAVKPVLNNECRRQRKNEPYYQYSIDCIQQLNNVSKFVDAIKYDNPVKGKTFGKT